MDESCGKCTPCRIGTKRMLEILERIAEGKGEHGDIDKLEDAGAEHQGQLALCGLGQTAPNPVLSTIKYFRDEYEAHIYEKRCPAGVLQEAAELRHRSRQVQGLHCLRARVCPAGAISGTVKEPHTIDHHQVPQVRRLHGEVQVRRDREAVTLRRSNHGTDDYLSPSTACR